MTEFLMLVVAAGWWVHLAWVTAQRIAAKRQDAGLPVNPGTFRACLMMWPVFAWQDSSLRRLW